MSVQQTEPAQTALGSIGQVFTALVNQSADLLAKAAGVWMAAKAAISTVSSGIAAAAVEDRINQARARYQFTPLTPAVLADMVIRNLIDEPTAAGQAALSGLSADRFHQLVLETGESYGIVDALRLWNRGHYMTALEPNPGYDGTNGLYQPGANLAGTYGITTDELETVIHYSRVRDQFIPDLLKSAKNSLSPADAVELAVKQIVAPDVARSLFEAAGGVGEQFEALVAASGDSAGVEKAAELILHGLIDRTQMMEILGLSRLNPRFYYLALPDKSGIPPIQRRWLSPYEIEQATKAGMVSADQAMQWLVEQGYAADQAAAFTTAVASGAAVTPKHETAAMVLAEYEAGMIPATSDDPKVPGATQLLEALGYVAESIPIMLQTAEWKRAVASRNSTISRIRAAYLIGEIDRDTVTKDLANLRIPTATIPQLLDYWTLEGATPHLHLSAAQVGKLVEEGHLTGEQGLAKWQAMGYSAGDAALLLAYIYPPPTPAAAPPPPLPLSNIPAPPGATGPTGAA